jgi:1-acyl-sn-glycerol-3-phosphate acyltransferase
LSAAPAIGPRVPRRHSRVLPFLGRAVLRALRWRIEGEIPNLAKFVIAVAPHTSNWDFVIGAAAMFALDLRLSFIGKHTIFVGPVAPILRWMGGIPVDRASPHGVVEQSVRAFADSSERILAIAPQGTRKPVPHFRSGFLHIARGARVPVVLAALDYGERCVRIGPLLEPGGDIEAERARIEAMFSRVRGRHPRVASPV